MRADVVRRDVARDGGICEALGACDLFISIGTSGTVIPRQAS
jgi:NAD-dependent SIR2 family protein deacetylase